MAALLFFSGACTTIRQIGIIYIFEIIPDAYREKFTSLRTLLENSVILMAAVYF
jgi:hypothetical protein